MSYSSPISPLVLRKHQVTRATEDASGILVSALTFSLTLGGMCSAIQWDVYYWMQVLPMMLEIILTGVALIYFTASLVVTFAKPRSWFTSLLSDLFWLIPALVIGIGFASYYTWTIHHYPKCGLGGSYSSLQGSARFTICDLTIAGMAFSWLFVVAVGAILTLRFVRYTRLRAPIKMTLVGLAWYEPTDDPEVTPKALEETQTTPPLFKA